jgi:hypothetical protein
MRFQLATLKLAAVIGIAIAATAARGSIHDRRQ